MMRLSKKTQSDSTISTFRKFVICSVGLTAFLLACAPMADLGSSQQGLYAIDPIPPIEEEEDDLDAPFIEIFSAFQDELDETIWTISGQVTGVPDAEGLMVEFGGLAAGAFEMTGEDGLFELVIQLPIASTGPVTAETESHDAIPSNVATYEI